MRSVLPGNTSPPAILGSHASASRASMLGMCLGSLSRCSLMCLVRPTCASPLSPPVATCHRLMSPGREWLLLKHCWGSPGAARAASPCGGLSCSSHLVQPLVFGPGASQAMLIKCPMPLSCPSHGRSLCPASTAGGIALVMLIVAIVEGASIENKRHNRRETPPLLS